MSNKKGLLALSPLFLLIVLIVAFTVYSVDSSHQDTSLSLTVAFMISSIYAVAISGGMPVRKRVDTYSKGAGANNLMLMLWIYVLAGSLPHQPRRWEPLMQPSTWRSASCQPA